MTKGQDEKNKTAEAEVKTVKEEVKAEENKEKAKTEEVKAEPKPQNFYVEGYGNVTAKSYEEAVGKAEKIKSKIRGV